MSAPEAAAKAVRAVPWGWLVFGIAALVLGAIGLQIAMIESATGLATSSTTVANAAPAIDRSIFSIRQILAVIGTVFVALLAFGALGKAIFGNKGGGH